MVYYFTVRVYDFDLRRWVVGPVGAVAGYSVFMRGGVYLYKL